MARSNFHQLWDAAQYIEYEAMKPEDYDLITRLGGG